MVRQHAAQFGAPYLAHLVAAVPEPSAVLAAVVVGLGTVSQRRREAVPSAQ
jgi:hypothetical protein